MKSMPRLVRIGDFRIDTQRAISKGEGTEVLVSLEELEVEEPLGMETQIEEVVLTATSMAAVVNSSSLGGVEGPTAPR